LDCRQTARAPRLSACRWTARLTSGSVTRPYTVGSRVPRRLRFGPCSTRMAGAARRAIAGREYTARGDGAKYRGRGPYNAAASDGCVVHRAGPLISGKPRGHDGLHAVSEMAGGALGVGAPGGGTK